MWQTATLKPNKPNVPKWVQQFDAKWLNGLGPFRCWWHPMWLMGPSFPQEKLLRNCCSWSRDFPNLVRQWHGQLQHCLSRECNSEPTPLKLHAHFCLTYSDSLNHLFFIIRSPPSSFSYQFSMACLFVTVGELRWSSMYQLQWLDVPAVFKFYLPMSLMLHYCIFKEFIHVSRHSVTPELTFLACNFPKLLWAYDATECCSSTAGM